jgi:uncharacterized RDD family membrane protein YckC
MYYYDFIYLWSLEMSENLYAAPVADVVSDAVEKNAIASKMNRFLAALIDTIIMMVVVMPFMFFMGIFALIMEGQEPSLVQNLSSALFGLVVFFIINTHFLMKSGQTIGKKMLGIKIVDMDGNLPSFSKHLLKRYAMYFGLGYIPLVGQLLSLISVLIIFAKDTRCGHDYVAGTKVVDC